MAIFCDEDGDRGEGAYTCIHHRDLMFTEAHERCSVCSGETYPVYYINRGHGYEQHFIKGEVLHSVNILQVDCMEQARLLQCGTI